MNTFELNAMRVKSMPSHSFPPNASLRVMRQGYVANFKKAQ